MHRIVDGPVHLSLDRLSIQGNRKECTDWTSGTNAGSQAQLSKATVKISTLTYEEGKSTIPAEMECLSICPEILKSVQI
mgnify:CR=1 FL=1